MINYFDKRYSDFYGKVDFMPTFTDRDLRVTQIIGGATIVVCLIMGITGLFFLKHEIGPPPEHAICLKNTGWTMLLVACIWTGLATWRRITK
jgi:hypothetical protein